MLTDSQMQRLAEMCGWDEAEDYWWGECEGHYTVFCDGGQLTPAGYFTVIKVLGLYVSITAEDTWLAGSYREDADENDEGEGDTLEAAIDAALDYSL